MADDTTNDQDNTPSSNGPAAGPDAVAGSTDEAGTPLAKKPAAKRAPAKKAAAKKAPAKKAAAKKATTADPTLEGTEPVKAPAKRSSVKKSAATTMPPAGPPADVTVEPSDPPATAKKTSAKRTAKTDAPQAAEAAPATAVLFQTPDANPAPARSRRRPAAEKDSAGESTEKTESGDSATDAPAEKPKAKKKSPAKDSSQPASDQDAGGQESPAEQKTDGSASTRSDGDSSQNDDSDQDGGAENGDGTPRRRRRRGGRRRRKGGGGNADGAQDNGRGGEDDSDQSDDQSGGRSQQGSGDARNGDDEDADGSTRRRRRRRREGDNGGTAGDDPQNTVTRVRKARSAEDEITSLAGSTRLEAKKQRRREGREAGRRRAPIVSEAEFLARREAVDRVMVIRQRQDLTQIGVLEDKVLVEHYVARESQASMIGNVYLGRVQNVLPSMEAAFIDIGKGRNAVLYAGEVNWSSLGHKDGSPRKIESVLTSGQPVLVQVTKDPIGHKGARLTSQISMAGRFLVYVPDGTTSGISRKLPDTERNRLKTLLKEIVPDTAGVIVRTAAEGASEEELTRDVERLKARWEDVEAKSKGKAPQLLYGEPDLTLKVVRDLFTEDFATLVIQGDDAWQTVEGYVSQVAPDLADRLEKFEDDRDIFAAYRVDEQIAKALDRKVWLPSGGSLVIDRTEAMTVIDVNTGKFTGSGGNLEETVTKNNLEAAEEVVRQLRLRDIGGIIVVDFIDMVLESNRDLVLRRMVECLGRDRTRHQVAEVTSLGLVQMTRKRIGVGLVESFSHNCEHCQGRGVVIQDEPVEPKNVEDDRGRSNRRRGSNNDGDGNSSGGRGSGARAPKKSSPAPSPKDVAAMSKPPSEDPVAEAASETASEPTPETTAEPAPETTPEPVSAAPQVTTRTRSRRNAPKAATDPDSSTEAPAVAAPDEPVGEPAPAVATPAEAAPVQTPTPPTDTPPAAPAAPQVVTRTRTRRSASRPAGTPAAAPAPIVVSTPAASDSAAEPATVSEPVRPTEPPKVVTRTRGRRATRDAGPPAGDGGASDS